ncbi:MAG: 1-acyl-sn-glycerol-3-phosphate acyltransferase [Gaiellaceae bacterium]|jgi:1-acyl-sn-glycerol-3-phosphate acyltransferase|nr:1-acyl-sn-glycerol-3-phosphate acyltransferase [Gaiellaceae bacterium]MDX6470886.1 1-acyl-sn-glycerol-3-phosphate acyltransferase [Gaiellaceae bacterium]MDX6471190.1 1-acyl-sn-glycerol-3-phosphate acyltransferase [Gaiellaceae bacterium]
MGAILPPMRPTLAYNVIAAGTWPLLYGLFRLRSTGQEHVPEGGCVLACNHLSSFDPWPLGMPLWPRTFLRFMAKSELYWFPLGPLIGAAGAFPVHRGQRDTLAIETAVQLARDGNVVAMFPEGTRRVKGLMKRREARPRTGAARIALEAGVPLVPAAVKGTDGLRRLAKLRVAYGAPVDIDDLRGGEIAEAAQEATTRLMARIAELEESL